MRCHQCGSSLHATPSCPFLSRRSSVFGAPRISMDAMPNRVSDYHGEKKFEDQVCVRDRDAFKKLVDGGLDPPRMRGSEKVLQKLGG